MAQEAKPTAGWHYKLGDSLLEKAILRVVNYWWPRGNAFRSGHRWLVLGTEELQDRLPMIGKNGGRPSIRSIQRALAQLRDDGILVIEHHRHAFRPGMGKVLWLRPNIDRIGALVASRRRSAVAPLAETNIHSTGEQKTEGQDSGKPPSPVEEDEVQSGEYLTHKGKKATVEAAQAIFSEKKQASDYPIVAKPEIAHKCLRDACIAAGYPSPGSFNKKRGGQMRTMLKRMAEEDVEPDQVAEVIFFIAKKWPEFMDYCKAKFSVVVPGSAPNHNALTLHAVEAVGFWRSYKIGGPVKEKVASEYGSSLDEGF